MFYRTISRGLNLLNKPLASNLKFKRWHGRLGEAEFVKTTMVQLKPEEGFSLQITGVDEFGFRINNNIRVIGPIAIFPKTIYRWNVADVSQINEKSLSIFPILEPRVDILIIGTGDRYSKIDPSVPKWLIKNKINNFEILPTEKASHVFNFLVADNRFVGAVLLPSLIETTERDPSVKKVFDRAELYRELEREDKTRPIGDAAKPAVRPEPCTNKLV